MRCSVLQEQQLSLLCSWPLHFVKESKEINLKLNACKEKEHYLFIFTVLVSEHDWEKVPCQEIRFYVFATGTSE